jgi:hypothetical protein
VVLAALGLAGEQCNSTRHPACHVAVDKDSKCERWRWRRRLDKIFAMVTLCLCLCLCLTTQSYRPAYSLQGLSNVDRSHQPTRRGYSTTSGKLAAESATLLANILLRNGASQLDGICCFGLPRLSVANAEDRQRLQPQSLGMTS